MSKNTGAVAEVGSVWALPTDRARVTLPDGSIVTVSGGLIVLDRPGVFRCGRKRITATTPEEVEADASTNSD